MDLNKRSMKKSKFAPGDRVYLFNSLSCKVESDDVYGCLFVPVAVEGKASEGGGKSLKEKLEGGYMEVKEQYQLVGHQGIVDADVLFASEEECRAWYRAFFAV